MIEKNKKLVYDFWDEASCGENLYLKGTDLNDYNEQSLSRYKLEPYIAEFADFKNSKNKKILEIGVGLGADHECFAKNGAKLWGIDLTNRAVNHTKKRLKKQKTNEAWLAFGEINISCKYPSLSLSKKKCLKEASKNLYRMLRMLDKKNVIGIAVENIPNKGIGIALNDRLLRASKK